MVTAELAMALPAVVLVLALALAGLTLGLDQVRCVDAARVAARAASRGEAVATVEQLAVDRAPRGSQVVVRRGAEQVEVHVEGPGRGRVLALPPARATGVALWEPGAAP